MSTASVMLTIEPHHVVVLLASYASLSAAESDVRDLRRGENVSVVRSTALANRPSGAAPVVETWEASVAWKIYDDKIREAERDGTVVRPEWLTRRAETAAILNAARVPLPGSPLVVDVDVLPNGHVRLATTCVYPDGGSVDLFVHAGPQAPWLLSDLGQTTAWLLNGLTMPSMEELERVLLVYGARQNGGAFEVDFSSLDELVAKVPMLAHACETACKLMGRAATAVPVDASQEGSAS